MSDPLPFAEDADDRLYVLPPTIDDDLIERWIAAIEEERDTAGMEPIDPEAVEELRDFLGELVGDDDWAAQFAKEAAHLGQTGLLDPAERARLLISLGRARGERGFTFNDYMNVLNWANRIRVGQGLLELALAGSIYVEWDTAREDAIIQRAPLGE